MNKTQNTMNMKPTKKRALVVDDTHANHDIIHTFLQDIDMPCDSAFDGMEAVSLCDGLPKDYYSLILMDIHLPRINGFEAARTLRSMGIEAPIIAVTAAGKEDHRLMEEMAADDGVFDAILHKPFRSTTFFAALSPFLKNVTRIDAAPKPQEAETMTQTMKRPDAQMDSRVCDMDKAIANMGNSLRLFTKHFNHFKQNNADLTLRIQALLDKGDYVECALLCHSIKGLSGMLGLTRLYAHVVKMERLLHGFLPNMEPLQALTGGSDANVPEEPHGSSSDASHNSNAFDVFKEIDDLLLCIGNDIRLVCQMQI